MQAVMFAFQPLREWITRSWIGFNHQVLIIRQTSTSHDTKSAAQMRPIGSKPARSLRGMSLELRVTLFMDRVRIRGTRKERGSGFPKPLLLNNAGSLT